MISTALSMTIEAPTVAIMAALKNSCLPSSRLMASTCISKATKAAPITPRAKDGNADQARMLMPVQAR